MTHERGEDIKMFVKNPAEGMQGDERGVVVFSHHAYGRNGRNQLPAQCSADGERRLSGGDRARVRLMITLDADRRHRRHRHPALAERA